MGSSSTSAQSVKAFISYAHDDEVWRDALVRHLTPLTDEGVVRISPWHDRKILAGTEWKGEIDRNLEEAQIILLLISSYFTSSKYCKIELKRAMERHDSHEAIVIPIIVRPVDWTGYAQLSRLQALPRDARPVTSWEDPDLAFTDIAKGIRQIVEDKEPVLESISEPSSTSKESVVVLTKQPSPYEEEQTQLISFIIQGKVVPFLGADINLCNRPGGENGCPFSWDPQSPFPPSSNEIAVHLDNRTKSYRKKIYCPFCETETANLPEGCPIKGFATLENNIPANVKLNLQNVSQFVELDVSSGEMYDNLNSIISSSNYRPNDVHKFFALLPSILKKRNSENPYQLIVTTNLDNALEKAFRAAWEEFDLVYYSGNGHRNGRFIHRKPNGEDRVIDNPSTYNELSLKKRSIVLKLYGPIGEDEDRGKAVITEDHYIDYLAHKGVGELIPASLLSILKHSHVCFLGYSLSYWHLRVILHRLWKDREQKRDYKWWAVENNPQILDKSMWEQKFGARFIEYSLERFISELNNGLNCLPLQE